MNTALMENNHSKDFIVRLALQSKLEEGMVSKEELGETSLVAAVDGDEHSKMFLVKMAFPSLIFAASFVAFVWYSPALFILEILSFSSSIYLASSSISP